VALPVRVAPKHAQRAVEARQPEDRLQRGGLAGAVGADQADDPAFRTAKETESSARVEP